MLGKWNDKTYSYGFYDVALTMVTRKSILEKYGIRIPTADKPWTKDEFTAALDKIKASGDYRYPLDIATSFTGEWWPYAYSPFLQSFGGDLINRNDYKSADGVLNGPQALEWAKWFRGLVTNKYIPLKSGTDPAKDFMNGKTAILYNGSWTRSTTRKKFKDVRVPAVGGPRQRPEDRWRLVAVGHVDQLRRPRAGAADYLKFAAQDKYVASVAKATTNIPATDAAAAQVPGFGPGRGERGLPRATRRSSPCCGRSTPGYPFIATEFTKTAQDILNGADPQQALDQAVKDIDANQKSNNYFQ